jgi:Fe-S-cluster containining protein
MHTPDDMHAARQWREAVARPGVASALEGVYAEVAQEVASRGPACWASGRCCNFAKAGHRLYVTGIEAAYVVSAPPPHASDAARAISLHQLPAHSPSPLPACPFLDATLCSIHTIKPLACRTYFCDASARAWQQDLTEHALRRIRELHDAHAVAYRYAEWGWMLGLMRRARG